MSISKLKAEISVYSSDEIYGTAFFQGDKLITYIHENDAQWRQEYFAPIMNAAGVTIKQLSKLNKRQREALEGYL